MKTLRVLFVALCLLFSTSTFSDYYCPIAVDSPLVTAMVAEGYSLELVSTLPEPMPYPRSIKELLDIADVYQQIAMYTMSFHSISLRAVLPVPLPSPKKAVLPLPPPRVLVKQAVQLQQHALWMVDMLDGKIESAYEHGTLSDDSYFNLMSIQVNLRDQISSLPIPLP